MQLYAAKKNKKLKILSNSSKLASVHNFCAINGLKNNSLIGKSLQRPVAVQQP